MHSFIHSVEWCKLTCLALGDGHERRGPLHYGGHGAANLIEHTLWLSMASTTSLDYLITPVLTVELVIALQTFGDT